MPCARDCSTAQLVVELAARVAALTAAVEVLAQRGGSPAGVITTEVMQRVDHALANTATTSKEPDHA